MTSIVNTNKDIIILFLIKIYRFLHIKNIDTYTKTQRVNEVYPKVYNRDILNYYFEEVGLKVLYRNWCLYNSIYCINNSYKSYFIKPPSYLTLVVKVRSIYSWIDLEKKTRLSVYLHYILEFFLTRQNTFSTIIPLYKLLVKGICNIYDCINDVYVYKYIHSLLIWINVKTKNTLLIVYLNLGIYSIYNKYLFSAFGFSRQVISKTLLLNTLTVISLFYKSLYLLTNICKKKLSLTYLLSNNGQVINNKLLFSKLVSGQLVTSYKIWQYYIKQINSYVGYNSGYYFSNYIGSKFSPSYKSYFSKKLYNIGVFLGDNYNNILSMPLLINNSTNISRLDTNFWSDSRIHTTISNLGTTKIYILSTYIYIKYRTLLGFYIKKNKTGSVGYRLRSLLRNYIHTNWKIHGCF